MSTIVVRHRSVLSDLWTAAVDAVPRRWRAAVAGPLNRIRIASDGAGFEEPHKPFRPVEISIASAFVLSRRLVIPRAGRQDVRYAVELLIKSETPFSPDELLIDVAFAGAMPDGGGLAYDIRLVPRTKVTDALQSLRIRPSRVRRIAIASEPPSSRVDFAAVLAPSRRWVKWLPTIPVVILVVAFVALAQFELALRQRQASDLEERVSEALTALRSATEEVELLRSSVGRGQTAEEAFASSLPAFLTLSEIRAKLPDATRLNKIEMRDRSVRLSIVTTNALEDAKGFGDQLKGWTATIEGAIAVDQGNGMESAVILLQPSI